jgi:hypothetical protein
MTSPADEVASVKFEVTLDRAEPWSDLSPTVVSIDIEDHDTQTDKATIVLDDNHEILGDVTCVGLQVRLSLGWNGENAVLFEGQVTESRIVTSGSGQRIHLVAYDFSYRMTLQTRDRTWTSPTKLSDVIKEIIALPAYGIAEGQIEPDPDPEVGERPGLHQRNVNDWQFLCELARRHNSRCFVEYNAGASKFYFLPIARIVSNPPLGALTYCRGVGSLLEFNFQQVGAGAAEILSSSSMNPQDGATVTNPAEVPTPPPEAPPPRTGDRPAMTGSQRVSIEALAELASRAQADLAPRTRRDGGRPSNPTGNEARLVRDPTRALGLSGSGVAIGNIGIRAKGKVSISGIAPWAEGDWYLNKVNHQFARERVNQRTSTSYRTRLQGTR